MAYATISKPSLHFNTLTYGGNDASGRAITGVGFQPDWSWFKDRSNAVNHSIFDSVRGVTKNIVSNTNAAESTSAQGLQAFGTDGFTLGSDGDVNGNNNNYASWNWKAGTTSGITTTGSTITPSAYSFNATAGFSIIKYNGNSGGSGYSALIPHGLGVAPKCVIVKQLNHGTENWGIYHDGLNSGSSPQTKTIFLNKQDDEYGATNMWYDTAPTTVNFSVGTNDIVNNTSADYIAYCFAEIKGYSKFGFYKGNGVDDGAFVYTGFKPAFLMIKNTSSNSTKWTICDNKREGFNAKNYRLFASETDAESTSNAWEMYSNGFKMTTTGSFVNAAGSNYIYLAFAEEPLVANVGQSIPATAR